MDFEYVFRFLVLPRIYTSESGAVLSLRYVNIPGNKESLLMPTSCSHVCWQSPSVSEIELFTKVEVRTHSSDEVKL